MIIVTGVSGTVGSAVLLELQKSGQPVRAMFRNLEDARKAPSSTATVVGDFADKDSLHSAFAGADVLFLVCSPIPQLIELESNAIEVAAASGVKHIVLNSALGAGKYDKSFPSWHRKVEEKLAATKLNYTILRPNGFFQNIVTYNAPTILSQNAFYGSTGDAKISILDVRDVALAAAHILADPSSHNRQIYELNGPEALTNDDVAVSLSRLLGRTIQYVDLLDATFRNALAGAGLPEWQVNALLELQQYYRSGKCAEVTNVLSDLLGRPSIKLDQFLLENKSRFQPLAAKG